MTIKPAQKITPFLWFDSNAEEAVQFYLSVFKNSKRTDVRHYGEAGPRPKGSVMTVTFELEGMEFIALNGGPVFKFTPAVSFFVRCDTQEEVDHLWSALSAGGTEIQCGWLTDKHGLSWQIVPAILGDYLQDPDPVKANRVMQAMLQMIKLDIAALKKAYETP
ncbi:MAG TPA: VOC family protein [Verrucomicrobiae bacterium]|jgi:predicted 3-demethylubiquinone-9 3-methyltransferase (glyoxalase superfamily)|nr:VOC family protein [Verrucomicrobiae bacterium]